MQLQIQNQQVLVFCSTCRFLSFDATNEKDSCPKQDFGVGDVWCDWRQQNDLGEFSIDEYETMNTTASV